MPDGGIDLPRLLNDPQRASTVPAVQRQALLDALAVHEGRCRLVRELLTAPLTATTHRPAPPLGEWLTAREVAASLNMSERTVRRRQHTEWREGTHWVRQGKKHVRFSRPALDQWHREQRQQAKPAAGLAFAPVDPPSGMCDN
jgi:hypothetical protein